LRPIRWLESCNAQVGSSIHLVVTEQGLDGLADVLAIEPCPRISSGVGRVVTETFTHVRGGILRIRLAGLAEPLGVTSNHSIYSSDRLDFVPAGELRVGETLRNLDGDVRIESIEQLGTQERVYNLEIHGEHVFRVASSGVLVHNSSGAEGSVNGPGKFSVGPYNEMKGAVSGLDAHHAGQSAAMKKVVAGYDHNTAPASLVPKVGHTIKGPNGIVSRSTKGIDNARDILARDINELRRVYPDIPNARLQELIEMNKFMYPEMTK